MTHNKTEALLKKINYIEADVEIQKQILFSIPSDQKTEMEKTITLIAARKKEIEVLRQELRELDPEEFDRIVIFENAVAEFKKIATDNPFDSIVNRNVNEECTLALQSGTKEECLIKACDNDGNWTIITIDGQLKQFPAAEVTEKPPKKDDFQ
jgi:biotin-(acetyl-CoA carboxylase) ligase